MAHCAQPHLPSLLGMPYAALHSDSSAVVGSTKRSHLTPAEALAELAPGGIAESADAMIAAGSLQTDMAETWEPLSGWMVTKVQLFRCALCSLLYCHMHVHFCVRVCGGLSICVSHEHLANKVSLC